MENNSIELFNYGESPVRTINRDGAIWFVAKDVCDILGYANVTDTLKKHLDDDEKASVLLGNSGRGNPNVNIINESGLYTLILRSNKKEAKPFRKWVTGTVLPSIREKGYYDIEDETENLPADSSQDEQATTTERPAMRRTRGAISGARQIIEKALSCTSDDDYKATVALDRVFQNIFGYSALEAAGFRLGCAKTGHVWYDRVYNSPTTSYDWYFNYGWEFDMPTPNELPEISCKLVDMN